MISYAAFGLTQCTAAVVVVGWALVGYLWFGLSRVRYFALMFISGIMVASAAPTARFLYNAQAGCFPWSPAEVPYYPGMTVCPGQSVVAHTIIIIPTPRFEYRFDIPVPHPEDAAKTERHL